MTLLRKFKRKFKYKLKYYFTPVPKPEKWVFIVGCTNSGTTLLNSILALHPSIASLPDEGQFCTNQLPLGKDVGPKRLWAVPSDRLYLDENSNSNIDLIKLKKHWAVRFNDLSRPIFMEKSPPNTVRLRWLQANFSNSYFIGIHRNGYAVAEGIKRKVGHSVDLGARQWNNSNKILLKDFEYLNNKLLLSYEQLTEEPEFVLNKICEFINIPSMDPSVLKSRFTIHGQSLQIANMNARSINNLSSNELISIEKEADECLKFLGYYRNYENGNL